MNTGELDICIKIGLFLIIFSIICRVAVSILYKVLAVEAEQIERTKNPILCKLRTSLKKRAAEIRGRSKKRICVEMCLKEIRVAGISLRILPLISLYAMLGAILVFGLGAYGKITEGMFLLESFPFYIVAFAGVYAYLFVASLTDYDASRTLLKDLLTDYLDELETIDFVEKRNVFEEQEEIRVGNVTKKSRNKEKEKLLKEFLS